MFWKSRTIQNFSTPSTPFEELIQSILKAVSQEAVFLLIYKRNSAIVNSNEQVAENLGI